MKRCKRCACDRGSVDVSHRLLLLRFSMFYAVLRISWPGIKLFSVCAYLADTAFTAPSFTAPSFTPIYLDKELSTFTVLPLFHAFYAFTLFLFPAAVNIPLYTTPYTHPLYTTPYTPLLVGARFYPFAWHREVVTVKQCNKVCGKRVSVRATQLITLVRATLLLITLVRATLLLIKSVSAATLLITSVSAATLLITLVRATLIITLVRATLIITLVWATPLITLVWLRLY